MVASGLQLQGLPRFHRKFLHLLHLGASVGVLNRGVQLHFIGRSRCCRDDLHIVIAGIGNLAENAGHTAVGCLSPGVLNLDRA